MGCSTGEVGRLTQLKRPIRVIGIVLAVGLVGVSFTLSNGIGGSAAAAAGCAVLVVVLLLPVITEFEIDVLGFRARANLSARAGTLQTVCEQVSARVASLLRLVGVEQDQIPAIVEEAVQDSCRLWRGPVNPDLVARLVVCRVARLIQLSLRLGGPYRIDEPDRDPDAEPAWIAFAHLAPQDRLIVALVSWIELSEDQVGTMLDVDQSTVADAVARWSTGETRGVRA